MHTPGPWGLQESPDGGMILIRGNDADRMKRHPQTHLQIVPVDDAKLIAAAPELLDELQHLVRLLEPLEADGSLNVPGLATLNGARAAIRKATA